MTLKSMLQTAVLALSLSLAAGALNPALAHGGDKPSHGGVVQVAQDLSFELVARAEGATLHLTDHGKPVAAQGVTGKLTVLQGASRTEAALVEDGENRLRAPGLKLAKGDKVVAVLTNVAGKTVTVRFTVK